MSERLLEATDLYRFFRSGDEEVRALRGVSLHVESGEFVAIAGPSGSGKSTLLSCLAGLDEPAGGFVRYGTERMTNRSESQRARIRARLVGVLLQGENLLPHLTVRQNVRLVQRLARIPPAAARPLLELLGLGSRADAYPRELSGGESARAGLAVALAAGPRVLLADEPTGELDSATEQEVLVLLRERATSGSGVLVVTHSPAVVAQADRVIQLRDGMVAA